jgi:hypothetical protein
MNGYAPSGRNITLSQNPDDMAHDILHSFLLNAEDLPKKHHPGRLPFILLFMIFYIAK